MNNHYDWLEKWLPAIIKNLGIVAYGDNGIVAEGDKCYSWEANWKAVGIPFPHGVAMYILSKTHPWSQEVRQTKKGWVDVYQWIVDTYPKLKEHFPNEDLDHWL